MGLSHPPSDGAPLRPKEPLLVYLDLNKWVDLAHAEARTDKAKQYEAALEIAGELVTTGRAVFPLSFAHFMEVAKIGEDKRRRDLARLMVRLSQGWFLASAGSLVGSELRRAIAAQFGKPFLDVRRLALTRSLKSAMADPKLIEAAGDFNETLFQSPIVLEEFIATARVGRGFINNWQTFADQHEAGRALRWETSREVRKRAYCALVTIGFQDRLADALSEFGLTMSALAALGPEGLVAFLESIPMLDVEINLHVERNEHRDRKIAPNDEIDLGFLSLAVPHCHVVITEKFWTDLVIRQKLDRKYDTVIGSDVSAVLQKLRA